MSEFRVEDRVQVIGDLYGVIKGFDRGYAWIHYDHGGYVTAATITLSPAPPDTVTITISRETAEDYIAARVDDSSLYWAEGEIHYAIREALKETDA